MLLVINSIGQVCGNHGNHRFRKAPFYDSSWRIESSTTRLEIS